MSFSNYDAGANRLQNLRVLCLLDEFEQLLKGRQRELFRLMRQGATQRQSAHIMGLCYGTVKRYAKLTRENIRKRYHKYNLFDNSLADWLKTCNHPYLLSRGGQCE